MNVGQEASAPRPIRLSPKQKAVCELIVEGLTNKEIANKLKIGSRTVEAHREEIFRRLNVRNAVELVRKMIVGKDSSQ